MAITRLNHAVLYVRDAAASARWYEEVFGLQVVTEMPGAAFLRAAGSDNHHDLGLFSVGAGAPGPQPGRVGLYHLAWEVGSVRDLVTAQEAAVADGDVAEYATLDARFHQEIVAAGGNALLTTFSVSLRERQQRMVAHSVRWDPRRAATFVAGHRALVDALEVRDTRTYKRRIQRHLEDARAGL